MHGNKKCAPLVEPYPVADEYVDGIASVEKLSGSNFRFTFYVNHVSILDGTEERIVVRKLVAARMSAIEAIILVARAIGFYLMGEVTNQNAARIEEEAIED